MRASHSVVIFRLLNHGIISSTMIVGPQCRKHTVKWQGGAPNLASLPPLGLEAS